LAGDISEVEFIENRSDFEDRETSWVDFDSIAKVFGNRDNVGSFSNL
jgi:hypothetical protein